MQGSSGASLVFQGDTIQKACADALSQCAWFAIARSLPLHSDIRLPSVSPVDSGSYRIEFIEGTAATMFSSTRMLDALYSQIMLWSQCESASGSTWNVYLERLDEHARLSGSSAVQEAVSIIAASEPFPSSFCHGDLTLENILVRSDGALVLIDPNFKDGLFQSYALDLGKLLQSVHSDYHRLFDSHAGIDPSAMLAHLRSRMPSDLWRLACIAELSHVVRLRKYRPESQRHTVDKLLERLMGEL